MNYIAENQKQGLKHLGILKENGSFEKGFSNIDLEIFFELNILLKIFKKENKILVFQNLDNEMNKLEFDLDGEKAKTLIKYFQKKKDELNKKNLQKRTRFEIRITEKEKSEIQERADKSGLSLSEFSRRMLLNGEVISISSDERKTLNGVAINFNQMIKLWHSTKEKPLELETKFSELLSELKKHYKR